MKGALGSIYFSAAASSCPGARSAADINPGSGAKSRGKSLCIYKVIAVYARAVGLIAAYFQCPILRVATHT